MKVNELREITKKYNETEKEKIIVELYKRIPKNIKEDYNIDDFITNLNVKIEKENTEITIERLEKEVKYFLECAYDDLYARPNKIVSKNERSKWRFKVKTFYKNYSRIDISFWQCFIEFITLPDDVFLQICAFTKAMYRMNFSHNFLLEWTTAREAENLKDKKAKYYFKNMNFQIYVAIILIGIVSSYLTYSPFSDGSK